MLLTLLAAPVAADDTAAIPLRFFVLGDAPYNAIDLETTTQLLAQAQDAKPRFIAHVGDFKGGSSPCEDRTYQSIRRLFSQQTLPMVYSPGDNDWTDCRRQAAGAHDPVERLSRLRQVFFEDPSVLRLAMLPGLETAAAQGYPELLSYKMGGTRLVSLHVVGSANNRVPGDPEAMAEWRQRSAANHRWLASNSEKEDFDRLVILFHANPGFHRRTPHPAYAPLLGQLRDISRQLTQPILLAHGDSHDFQFDQPYADRVNLWRLEVPGYPHVAGVMVEVTKEGSAPFQIEFVATEHDMLLD